MLAPGDDDEEAHEEPGAKLQKSVDEPEDRKEEYDEEGEEEKATVAAAEAPKDEPAGKNWRRRQEPLPCWVINSTLCDFSVSLYEICKSQRVGDQD